MGPDGRLPAHCLCGGGFFPFKGILYCLLESHPPPSLSRLLEGGFAEDGVCLGYGAFPERGVRLVEVVNARPDLLQQRFSRAEHECTALRLTPRGGYRREGIQEVRQIGPVLCLPGEPYPLLQRAGREREIAADQRQLGQVVESHVGAQWVSPAASRLQPLLEPPLRAFEVAPREQRRPEEHALGQ